MGPGNVCAVGVCAAEARAVGERTGMSRTINTICALGPEVPLNTGRHVGYEVRRELSQGVVPVIRERTRAKHAHVSVYDTGDGDHHQHGVRYLRVFMRQLTMNGPRSTNIKISATPHYYANL